MKIELHFKTIVEVDRKDFDAGLFDQDNIRVYFPLVYGETSIIKDVLKSTPIFHYSGCSLSPELDDQLKKLKNLLR